MHTYKKESVIQNMQVYVRNLVDQIESLTSNEITLPSSSEKVTVLFETLSLFKQFFATLKSCQKKLIQKMS